MELAKQKYEVKFLQTKIWSLMWHGSMLIVNPKQQNNNISTTNT